MNRTNKDKTRQLQLLSQSAMLEEARTPHLIRSTMFIICFCFIVFMIWASQTHIKEMAKTTGKIVPSGYIQSIQHLEGGIIEQILVRDDDTVKEGQTLLILKGDNIKSDYRGAQSKIITTQLQASRLDSFLTGNSTNFDKKCQENPDICSAQKGILTGMLEAQAQEKQVIAKQLKQKIGHLNLLKKELNIARNILKINKQSHKTQKELYQDKLVAETTYLSSLKDLNEQQGKTDTLQIKITQAQDAIHEYEWRLQSIQSTTRNLALEKIGSLEIELAETEELAKKLKQQINRLSIRAPTEGVIKGLNVHTLGGVIAPGKQIMEIVPMTGNLFGEVQISPNDIGHIKVDYPVIIKVTSYDFSRYGSINGTVQGLSATTFSNEQNPEKSYYKGVIALEKSYIGDQAGKNLLLPGMIINADIITGEKSLMSYFLKPIHKALNSAFSER